MYLVICKDTQHKAALIKGPDTISQGQLPGVPLLVCAGMLLENTVCLGLIQLCCDLRWGGSEAVTTSPVLSADSGEDCPLSPLLCKPMLAGAVQHTKTMNLHAKHNPRC